MPLGSNVGENVRELIADNKKKGKARGAGGKVRSRRQILAIALEAAKRGKNDGMGGCKGKGKGKKK